MWFVEKKDWKMWVLNWQMWFIKEERKSVLLQLLDPQEGLLYGGIEDILSEEATDAKRIMPDALSWENISNPLYFNSFSGPSDFDENGFATWQWTLPGSTEKMIIQKIDERLYWRAFEGAYH